MACFLISLKSLNYLVPIKDIVDIFSKLEKIEDDNEKKVITNKIFFYEEKILIYTHFNYDYDLPYNFLKNIMTIITPDMLNKDINEAIIKKYKEKLSNIVNYSFLCPIFVYYDVSVISFSCLKLAFEKTKLKIKLIDIIDIIKANKEMDISSIDFNDIEVCSSLIDDLVLKKLNLNFNIQNVAINNNINNINLQNNETKLKNDLNDDKKNINDKYALLAKKRK